VPAGAKVAQHFHRASWKNATAINVEGKRGFLASVRMAALA
jgi:hypothetical protein